MSPTPLDRIEELYHSAAALDPARRSSFLEAECAGDETLRQEIESLLALQDAAEDFMEISALDKEAAALAEHWTDQAFVDRIGRYRILERVGIGGMGVVYRAHDTHLNRTVAIKVLPPEFTADKERKARFIREAKSASALNHPNIVTIYDIGQAEGLDFIVMEYVEGHTLSHFIATRDLTVREALEYSVQIVQALGAAHAAGIIHRDIKPANIMITGAPRGLQKVKILDFGLAKAAKTPISDWNSQSNATARGDILGTAAYMSPEQAEGKPVDARSDIFSFGTVLYEMLSGRKAFPGDSNAAILAAVLHDEPAPLNGVPSELQKIVARCLRKAVGLRYQRTGELKQALEACQLLSFGSSVPIKSIAVLPFDNLSGDREIEYFGDGLTEEMINSLTKLPGLQVTARTSAFALRGRDLDIREIGARLNVEHVLEGSVRKAGNHIRVTAQLISVATGYHLWSERYDRQMTDVFTIQDEISRAIVDTLRVQLARDRSTVKRYTSSPEAYTLHLRGRHYLERRTPEGYARAKECFEQALRVDPQYTLAYLGLAEFYWQNALYGFQYPIHALNKSKEATLHALEIDDSLAESHAWLGSLLGISDLDWHGAEQEFQKALELGPNSPNVLFRYANYFLWPMERADEAIATMERTLALDPLSVAAHWVFGYYVYSQRMPERALKHMRAVNELEPKFYFANAAMGLVYIQQGLLNEAISEMERACETCPGNPFTIGILAYGLGRAGRTDEVMRLIRQMEDSARTSYMPAKSFMFAWAGIGAWDRALDWGMKSVELERDPMTIMNMGTEPIFDPVRSDPRYLAVLRKMNLHTAE